ncbi:NfeD family protein [Candidatus Finniella inopinata]|uniref:NfeD family protein n=1 Tax=Candidatus Finniella inopinata TaxID=1696036 RepID=A0A4Q7DK37_9PROT|nr:NfeD family protein [Candidatus Finniella inopinata]RZI47122.1 NfeD family protein [Candidatus Finniella inopinata]
MSFYITAWHWIGFSLILLCLELFVGSPGVSLLWMAIASFVVAIVISSVAINFWAQLGMVAVLSVLLAWMGKFLFKSGGSKPNNLNQPGQRLVNTRLTLQQPIKNGHSRVHIHDSIWRVEGPDMPAGTKVIVIGVKGNALLVDRLDYHHE